jgi:cation:H+ antiporter
VIESPLGSSFVLLASLLLLWKGADVVVHSAARIARRYGLSDLVIGMTVVSMGTSAPELAVTLSAALEGEPDIALGNIVGSNIMNTGIVLGATALFGGLAIPEPLARRDAPMLLAAALLLFAAAWDLAITRLEGLALLGVFLGYLVYLLRRDRGTLRAPEPPAGVATFRDFPLLLLGLLMLIGGGEGLVLSASFLAASAGVSGWAIGVTIVAAGTSAPECATSVVAALRGRQAIAVGNLIGSDLFNVLGILGVVASITTLEVTSVAPGSIALMILMVTMALGFLWTGGRLSRGEGLLLLVFALLRWSRDVAPELWG